MATLDPWMNGFYTPMYCPNWTWVYVSRDKIRAPNGGRMHKTFPCRVFSLLCTQIHGPHSAKIGVGCYIQPCYTSVPTGPEAVEW
jgi:hypothetical protein